VGRKRGKTKEASRGKVSAKQEKINGKCGHTSKLVCTMKKGMGNSLQRGLALWKKKIVSSRTGKTEEKVGAFVGFNRGRRKCSASRSLNRKTRAVEGF